MPSSPMAWLALAPSLQALAAQPPSLIAVLAAIGSLGGLLAAGAALLLIRQNRRLLTAQAGKAEAEGGASMISAAIALTKALREEEEACRRRLAELAALRLVDLAETAEARRAAAAERAALLAKIEELEKQMQFVRGLVREAGADLPASKEAGPQ